MPDKFQETREFLAAVRGERQVDLLLTGGKVINVFDATISETPVAIHDGRIVGFGDYTAKQQYDLKGAYLSPGFIEGHIHIESSKLVPPQFAAAATPHGTTTVVADPHEIANVKGLDGIRFMIAQSRGLPIDVRYMLPSCVPATNMETAGANLGARELAALIDDPAVLGIGEVMNFPGAFMGDPDVLAKIALAGSQRPIDGHSPGLSGRNLAAYIAAGPATDHECVTLEEAREKLAMGMRVMIREGSTAHNLANLLSLVTPATERRCLFASDDLRPGDLIESGHLDRILRAAVGLGLDPITALRMVTLNTAEAFGLRDRGAIRPGWQADLVAVKDMRSFDVLAVWKSGRLVAEGGALVSGQQGADSDGEKPRPLAVPTLTSEKLRVPDRDRKVRIIEIVPNQIITRAAVLSLAAYDGWLHSDPTSDIVKLVVIERYTGTGGMAVGFVKGLGLRHGAIASTVAHDSHNTIAAGVDDSSICVAVNRLIAIGGGQVATTDKVVAELPLPVAGLMSANPAAMVAEAEELLIAAAHDLGSSLEDPFMALSFLALPVIPELKLTDKGLVDVTRFALVSLYQE